MYCTKRIKIMDTAAEVPASYDYYDAWVLCAVEFEPLIVYRCEDGKSNACVGSLLPCSAWKYCSIVRRRADGLLATVALAT